MSRAMLSLSVRILLAGCIVVGTGSTIAQAYDGEALAFISRLTRGAFLPRVNHIVRNRFPVNKVMRGTRVTGESVTVGRVTMDVDPNQTDEMVLVFRFDGATTANTVGRNGPAVVHSQAETKFVCLRRVRVDAEKGFIGEPATISSSTTLTITGVDSTRGGLVGRIVRRIAARRAQQEHPIALADTIRDTQRIVCREFEQGLDSRLAEISRQPLHRLVAQSIVNGTTAR